MSSSPAVGDTWAILSPGGPWMSAVGSNWTPSPRQVFAARDEARRQIIRDAQSLRPAGRDKWRLADARDILKNWRSYRMQSYGHTENHKQLIRLNFVTPDQPDDGRWRRELYVVADGGSAYWQADYDPSTGRILWWQANGVA